MTTVTFYAETVMSRYIQLAVMQFDGRFVRNPLEMFDSRSQFEISFDEPHNCNKFMISVNTFEQKWF